MAYKSLMTVITDEATAAPALSFALDMAKQEQAHLDVLCLGVDRTQAGYYYGGANALVQQEGLDQAKTASEALEKHTRETLGQSEISWGCHAGIAQQAGLTRTIAFQARFADMMILPKPYGPDRLQEQEIIVEASLFDAHAPVMVVPNSVGSAQPEKIVLAWNESAESLRAIRTALPLLRAAASVNITIIDPPIHSADRSDPGGALSQMLARHGVNAEISILAKTLPRVSDVLGRHIRDIGADMLVMGAYGHSRFREAILGGATRDMLEGAEIPVFMAR